MSAVTVDQWIGLFREIGLSEEDMRRWHKLFEEKYPEGHQNFLEWLGIDQTKIKAIRKG